MSPRRRTPTRARAHASVDAILTAAAELLVSQGYARATTNRIARRAGVSVGTLYQYFSGKDDVFDGVAERLFGHVLEGAARVVAMPPATPLTVRLHQLIQVGLDCFARPPGLVRALDTIPSPAFRERLDGAREAAVHLVAQILATHRAETRVSDPTVTALLIVQLAEGVGRSVRAEDDLERLAVTIEEHVSRMVGARPAVAVGTSVHTLPTPCLVLDRRRLDANIARMQQRARHLGVRLRPHIKTVKSVDIARLAVGSDGPLTVSTLREAEHFAARGFTDLTYAVAIVPDRLDRVARLTERGVRLGVFVETTDTARALVDHPGTFYAWIEVDCGENRTGVSASADVQAIGQVLHRAPNCTLLGVATHGGHSYSARTDSARRAIAEEERAAAVEAANALRAVGIPCPAVSVGSTPTAVHAAHLDGVTEMRPGVYLLGDLFQAGVHSHSEADIACSVLATVLSHRPASGRVILDAGGLALSKDRSTAGWPFDAGYGRLADAVSGVVLEGLQVAGVHQEHGEVVGDDQRALDALPVGSRVRVLPNHVCMTAAQYDRYHVVDNGVVVAVWPRVNGW